MLVIISDLHFTDGTTSNMEGGKDLFNVDPRAFRLFFTQIASTIKRRKQKIRKVSFVYNGDIFDPLRTEVWFGASKENLPWSKPLNKTGAYKNVYEILEKTIAHNEEALAWLGGSHEDFHKEVWDVEAEIERIYIPGNHDRIINLDKSSRRLVRRHLLGQSRLSGDPGFKNVYIDSDHQSVVFHGHESDAFNCEFKKDGKPEYEAVPIGDAMTTMLFTKLGYEAGKLLIPKDARQRFKEIDNVRPHLAGIRYVQDIIRDFGIGKKVNKIIKDIVGEFKELPFYKSWIKQHDRWNIGFDEADKLQTALRAIESLGASVSAGLLEKLSAFWKDDSCEKWATRRLKEDLASRKGIHYCVLGHTHEPIHLPLYVYEEEEGRKVENHYLNCGTFRTTFTSTFDKQDFLRFQRMSYVIIYAPYEYDPSQNMPMYEMWSGLRMHH